jgi:hypothetical protein
MRTLANSQGSLAGHALIPSCAGSGALVEATISSVHGTYRQNFANLRRRTYCREVLYWRRWSAWTGDHLDLRPRAGGVCSSQKCLRNR